MWKDYLLSKKTFFITLSFLFLLNFLMTTHIFFLINMNYCETKQNEEKIEINIYKIDSLRNELRYLELEVDSLKASSIKKGLLIKEIQKELKK